MATVQQIVHQARERARTILVQEWPRVRALAITAEDEVLLERIANAFQLLLLADDIECRCHQYGPGAIGLSSLTPGAGNTSPAPGGEGDD
jgi:hypothetical protein